MTTSSEKRRVLLVGQPTLLSESLEHLLNGLEDVEVVGSFNPDENVIDHCWEISPDLIFIVDDETGGNWASGLTVAGKISAILLETCPELPIIRIRPDRNTLLIYTSQAVPARLADLVDLIRHMPLSGAVEPS
jgi:DNA-binding NarL/FixJ family response regulator